MLRIKACSGEIYRHRETGRWGFGVAWIKSETKPPAPARPARRDARFSIGADAAPRDRIAGFVPPRDRGRLYARRGTNSPGLQDSRVPVRIAGEFLMRRSGRCFCYFTNNEDSISTLRNAPECDRSRDSCSFVVAASLSAGECTRNIQSSLACARNGEESLDETWQPFPKASISEVE